MCSLVIFHCQVPHWIQWVSLQSHVTWDRGPSTFGRERKSSATVCQRVLGETRETSWRNRPHSRCLEYPRKQNALQRIKIILHQVADGTWRYWLVYQGRISEGFRGTRLFRVARIDTYWIRLCGSLWPYCRGGSRLPPPLIQSSDLVTRATLLGGFWKGHPEYSGCPRWSASGWTAAGFHEDRNGATLSAGV